MHRASPSSWLVKQSKILGKPAIFGGRHCLGSLPKDRNTSVQCLGSCKAPAYAVLKASQIRCARGEGEAVLRGGIIGASGINYLLALARFEALFNFLPIRCGIFVRHNAAINPISSAWIFKGCTSKLKNSLCLMSVGHQWLPGSGEETSDPHLHSSAKRDARRIWCCQRCEEQAWKATGTEAGRRYVHVLNELGQRTNMMQGNT